MEDVFWWLVALAFVLGLLFTFVFMLRRVTREAPVTQSIGVAAAKFAGEKSGSESATAKVAVGEESGAASARAGADRSGPSGSTINGKAVWLRDEKTAERDVLPVDGRPFVQFRGFDASSPRREIGSWVIAAAAFMLIAFRQDYVLPYVPLNLSPARFVLFTAAVLFIFTRLAGQQSRYRLGALGPILSIYALSVLVAYAATTTRPTPPPNVDPMVVREILIIFVVFFCCTVIHGYAGLTRVIKGLIAGAVVSAVLAILASFTGFEAATMLRHPGLRNLTPLSFNVDDLFRMGMVRPQASASHPLELACVLTTILPLALGLTLSLRAAGKRWWPWAVATAIVVAAITVGLSRSGMIGMFVAVAAMACNWPIRRTLSMLAVVGGIVTVGLVFQVPVLTAYLSIFGAPDSSVMHRAAVTSAFPFDILPFGRMGIDNEQFGGDGIVPDNQYLKTLAEMGVFGLLTYLMLVGTTLALAFLAFRNARNRANTQLPADAAHLFLGIAASFSAYAVVSIFLDTAGFVQMWTTMWLLIAIAAVAFRISRMPDGKVAVANNPRQDVSQVGMTAMARESNGNNHHI
jgi:hypothetical protein